jgi:hypothetical protein
MEDEKKKPFDKLMWRNLVLSTNGPDDVLTRYVLCTLERRMNMDGGSCYPSIRRISKDSGLDKGTVSERIRLACGYRQDANGVWTQDPDAPVWLERKERAAMGAGGQYTYRPRIPKPLWKTTYGAEKAYGEGVQGCTATAYRGVRPERTGAYGEGVHTTPETTPETTPLTTEVSFLPSQVERLWKLAGERLHLSGKATDADRATLHHLLSEGTYKPEQIERAIVGLRLAIEDGVFEGYVEPGESVSIGFLLRGKKNNRAVWAIAEEYYHREAA